MCAQHSGGSVPPLSRLTFKFMPKLELVVFTLIYQVKIRLELELEMLL
jgi:hypothetical protein